ncbi:MAG: DUF503 domain-containing protein [Fimbriimonadales bacterium]
MVVGVIEAQVRIDGAHSLKDKRRVLRSLIDRLRRKFGVSAAETDDQNRWTTATVGAACVSGNRVEAERLVQAVEEEISQHPEARVEQVTWEILTFP